MRKANDETRFGRRLESLFWWIVRLAPILLFLFTSLSDKVAHITISQAVDLCSENAFSNTLIYEFFYDLFNAATGVIPLVESQSEDFFNLMSWFALVEIGRFFLNFLLFIVRFANRLFDSMWR